MYFKELMDKLEYSVDFDAVGSGTLLGTEVSPILFNKHTRTSCCIDTVRLSHWNKNKVTFSLLKLNNIIGHRCWKERLEPGYIRNSC